MYYVSKYPNLENKLTFLVELDCIWQALHQILNIFNNEENSFFKTGLTEVI